MVSKERNFECDKVLFFTHIICNIVLEHILKNIFHEKNLHKKCFSL